MTFRRLNILAVFELGHPGIGFIGRHMQAGRSEAFPRLQRILAERLPLLFAIDILCNRRTNGSSSHGTPRKSIYRYYPKRPKHNARARY